MSDFQYCITRIDLEEKLDAVVGKTLGEVDTANVFDVTKTNPKVTGIAGDVIEQSVIGYPANPSQEPDLIVDDVEVELKTTGLRESKKGTGFEAKEPMSITAVSVNTIAEEEFENSNFWHKAKNMLLVYYLYDSPNTVPAAEYARFPIRGYQFHQFTDEEKETLRNDWQLVHDYIKQIQEKYPNNQDRERLYPGLSSALRNQLMLIDTAPKYPHPPRFRLKRSTVTTIARKNFGELLTPLPHSYTSYAQINEILGEAAEKYRGWSVETIAANLGVSVGSKNVAEALVAAIFGAKEKKMSKIEVFAKAGVKAKSIVLTQQGKRTEDMKLFTLDFNEFFDSHAIFEESFIYEYFAEGSIICIVFEEPSATAPLKDNIFCGFKQVSFDDDFINTEVRRTYNQIKSLIHDNKLKSMPQYNKNGEVIRNKTGVVRETLNFPKSSEYTVFVRGTSSDSTHKPEKVNGIEMYYQQIWVKGSYMAQKLAGLPYIEKKSK